MSAEKEFATKDDLKGLEKGLREEFRSGFKDFKDEIIHHFHIISEDLRTQMKQVAEGVSNVYEKSERDRAELKVEMNTNLNIHSLAITGVSEKLEKTNQELKREIRETRQEVLAAVKFSYAELA